MRDAVLKHTIAIFERLYRDMPPMVPDAVQQDMAAALEQLRHNYTLSTEELEQTVVAFGKRIWPYRKAFDEFYDIYDGELGESFLMKRVSPSLKKRYKEFLEYGGTYRDVHLGTPAAFFTSEERTALCEALVQVKKDIWQHVTQAVHSTDQRRYQERIIEFHTILDDIEKRLDTLRTMAEDEQEHPELATEIRAQVDAFEQGLCLLGPHTQYVAVCGAAEHFVGRKQEKKMIKTTYAL